MSSPIRRARAVTRRTVRLGLLAGLVAAAPGCTSKPVEDMSGAQRSALSSSRASDAFGFESLSDWTIGSGSASLGSPTTQGKTALLLQGPVNFTTLTSAPFALSAADIAPLATAGAPVLLDMMLPVQQPNPYWYGGVQMSMSCPSRGVFNAPLGEVDLTGRALGSFATFAFATVSSNADLSGGCSDFSLVVALNLPPAGTGRYVLDNIRWGASGPSEGGASGLPDASSSPLPGADANAPDAIASDPALGTIPVECADHVLQVVDLRADFRDIWAGREQPESGKRADREPSATLTFSAPIHPEALSAAFVPDDPIRCGPSVPATVDFAYAWTEAEGLFAQLYPAEANAFVHRDLSGVPSSDGPLLAGRNITLASFSVNAIARRPFGLIAGGSLDLTDGTAVRDGASGNPSGLPPSVTLVDGTLRTTPPIDFDRAFTDLGALSRALSNLAATGATQLAPNTIAFSGTEPLNVFRVRSSDLAAAASLRVDVPPGAAAIIDVDGESASVANAGLSLGGATPATVLWNFARAKTLNLSSLGFAGSILAPFASTVLSHGELTGTLVAANLGGSGTLHYAPLDVGKVLGAPPAGVVTFKASQPLHRSCRYDFHLSAAAPATSAGSCLASDFDVPFFVAQTPAVAASRELDVLSADRGTSTLRRFAAKAGINTLVEEVWPRYASRLRVDPKELVPGVDPRPSSTRAGLTRSFYQQVHLGYPVHGFGYFVESEGGLFRTAIGKVMPDLPPVLPAPIDEATARAAAAQHLAANYPSAAPKLASHGALALYAPVEYPSATDFALRWEFRIKAGSGVRAIHLDAATGRVSDVEQEGDEVTEYVGQVNQTVITLNHGPRSISVASFTDPTGSALSIGDPASLPDAAYLVIPPVNPGARYSFELLFDPNTDGNSTWDQSPSREAASAYWALGRTRSFIDGVGFEFLSHPWKGIDGEGKAATWILYDENRILAKAYDFDCPIGTDAGIDGGTALLQSNAFYLPFNDDTDPFDTGTINIVPNAQDKPVHLNAIAHEFSHGVFNRIILRADGLVYAPKREAGAISEGQADIAGMAVAHLNDAANPNWSCVIRGSTCARDAAHPTSSGHPDYYLGPSYVDYSHFTDDLCTRSSCTTKGNDNCGAHLDSTILSHWAYLLAVGSDGTNVSPLACGATVQALDANVDKALAEIVRLVWTATADFLSVKPTFLDLRDATIQAAAELYDQTAVDRVSAAWSAVGVGAAQPFQTFPQDGELDVDPWGSPELLWRSESHGPWRVRLSTDASFPDALTRQFDSSEVFSSDVIGSPGEVESWVNTPRLVPGAKYYWQVAPDNGSTTDWTSCITLSATFTTAPKRIELTAPTTVSDGLYLTDFLGEVTWDDVDFGDSYRITLRPSTTPSPLADLDPSSCLGGDDTLLPEVALGDSFDAFYKKPASILTLGGPNDDGQNFDATQEYDLYVMPLAVAGAPDPADRGTCTRIPVKKRALSSLEQVFPLRGPGQPPYYVSLDTQSPGTPSFTPPPLVFDASPEADQYRVVIQSWSKASQGGSTVVYQASRSLGECGLVAGTPDAVHPHPLEWHFDGCGGVPPSWIDQNEKSWTVYAVTADGMARQGWNYGEVNLADQAFFLTVLDHLPPFESSGAGTQPYLFSPSDFDAQVNGEPPSEEETINGVAALRYQAHARTLDPLKIIDPNTLQAVGLTTHMNLAPPPPNVSGYEIFYFDGGPEKHVDVSGQDTDLLQKGIDVPLPRPQPGTSSSRAEILVVPWLDDPSGTRVFSARATHVFFDITAECGLADETCCPGGNPPLTGEVCKEGNTCLLLGEPGGVTLPVCRSCGQSGDIANGICCPDADQPVHGGSGTICFHGTCNADTSKCECGMFHGSPCCAPNENHTGYYCINSALECGSDLNCYCTSGDVSDPNCNCPFRDKNGACHACGGEGEHCCTTFDQGVPHLGCNSDTLICGSDQICHTCGQPGEQCCTGNFVCMAGSFCNGSNQCQTCGQEGKTCCPGSLCGNSTACVGNQCVHCGGMGEPCCDNGGSGCAGGTCTDGKCVQQREACDTMEVAGGPDPDSRTFSLGKTSGTFTISYKTFIIADRISVTYTVNGNQVTWRPDNNVGFGPDGCVAGDNDASFVTSPALAFSGSDTVTVEIEPGCDPTADNNEQTTWQYVVNCAQ